MKEIKYQIHKDAIGYALTTILSSVLFPCLQRIVLFGSVARGTETKESDIDLLLVFSKDIENIPDYLKQYRNLKSDVSSDDLFAAECDLKFCIEDEWLTSDATIYQCIRKDGIVLWERN